MLIQTIEPLIVIERGQAVIVGSGVTVSEVLRHLGEGGTTEGLCAQTAGLSIEGIRAACRYAALATTSCLVAIVDVGEAERTLDELLQIIEDGGLVLISRDGVPVALIRPYRSSKAVQISGD